MEIRIRLPRIAAGAVSNLVGLLGVVAVVVAIGGLTGTWWWSALAGGVACVGLATLAQLAAERATIEAPASKVATAPTVRPGAQTPKAAAAS